MTCVLFICTNNSARSQMAEGMLRHYAGDRICAMSAGLTPKSVHPLAIRVMAEIGIDISEQKSRSLDEFANWAFVAHAITVCEAAEKDCPGPLPNGIERAHWPLDDPAAVEGTEEEQLAKFRTVRDQLAVHVQNWLDTVGQREL